MPDFPPAKLEAEFVGEARVEGHNEYFEALTTAHGEVGQCPKSESNLYDELYVLFFCFVFPFLVFLDDRGQRFVRGDISRGR